MTMPNKKTVVSDVLVSYIKNAQEKGTASGLITNSKLEDAAAKIAAEPKKINLTPSDDVRDNILRLCAGLRASGLDKHADSLEKSFLAYKVAADADKGIYDTSKGGGDGLVQDAHPEGSPKVEDAEDGHGVVENILKEHADLLKIVNKDPNGKLASAEKEQIINSLKIALADLDTPEHADPKLMKLQPQFKQFAEGFVPLVQEHILNVFDKKEPLYSAYFNKERKLEMNQVKDYFHNTWSIGLDEIVTKIPFFSEKANFSVNGMPFIAKTDEYIKKLYELIGKIDTALDSSVNHESFISLGDDWPDKMRRLFNPYREQFIAIYKVAHGGTEGWQGNFITPVALKASVDVGKSNLDSVLRRLTRHILGDGEISKAPAALTWFQNEAKAISDLKGQLDQIFGTASTYGNDMKTQNRDMQGLLTLQILQGIVAKIDPELVKDLKFESIDLFQASVKNLSKLIAADILATINSAVTDPALKAKLTSKFQNIEA